MDIYATFKITMKLEQRFNGRFSREVGAKKDLENFDEAIILNYEITKVNA